MSATTFYRSAAGRAQYRAAVLVSALFLLGNLALLPVAAHLTPTIPAFVALNQSALVLVYAVTTALLFSQYAQTRAVSLLLLASGGLYTTGIVFVQMLCTPNIFVPGLLMGQGSDTLTWAWTFWHAGPPLFALFYALVESDGRDHLVHRRAVGTIGCLAAVAVVALVAACALLVTRHVGALPKTVQGDDYRMLTASGVGPVIAILTILSLIVLCWTTRLRSVLQLWLAVSLFLLVLDNLVTDVAAARGTLGWVAGRIEALLAGIVILAVYMAELDVLRRRAQRSAVEQEAARLQAQTARDNLALALEASGMADWELDLNTGLARRTLRHDAIFGYASLQPRWTRADMVAHTVPEERDKVEAAFAHAIQDGRLEFETRIMPACGGEDRWIAVVGKTYYDAAGKPAKMAGCVMDTTERRRIGERLRQAERMESVGQLTGGVAHDFNNLLTVVIGSLEMIQRAPARAERVERFAAGALQAARRGAEVTGKLLAFSRRQIVRPEVASLNRLLQDFHPLLNRAAGQAEIVLDLDPALDPARLDVSQFEAALLNLVGNARDAMPDGGRITLATSNAMISAAEAVLYDLPSGPYLRLCVSDSGCGMDEAIVRAAFEPFFTTKEVGRGTGLGLSQVYGFARQAGGAARISSRPGEGTVVELLLPRSAIQPDLRAEPPPAPGLPLRRATRGEVVLVVDDDPSVLELTVESLADLGYETLTATSAAAALDLLRGSTRIDVMFSDVVMPGGMNGVQLAVAARAIRDQLKVVLASGYTASALPSDHEMPPGTPLLSKPYAREELAHTLQEILIRR